MLLILQELGPQFDVSVEVLKKEGEKYRYSHRDDYTHRKTQRIGNGTVPQGQSHINISSARNNLGDFWKAVETKKVSLRNSSNSHKA